jgi:hypothetical protein
MGKKDIFVAVKGKGNSIETIYDTTRGGKTRLAFYVDVGELSDRDALKFIKRVKRRWNKSGIVGVAA